MLHLTINGESRQLPASLSIAELLAQPGPQEQVPLLAAPESLRAGGWP